MGIAFAHLADRERFGSAPSKENSNINLSLVEGDDLEIDLAKTTMISSARALFNDDLYHLTARLNELLPLLDIDETATLWTQNN